jgi:hypothetical protein
MVYRRKRKLFGSENSLPKNQKADEVEPSRSKKKLACTTNDDKRRGVSTALRTTVIDMALIGDLWIVTSSVRHITKESASRKLLIRARDWQRSSTFTCRKCFNKYSTYTTKMIRAEDMEVNRRTVLALRVTERGL